MFIFDTILDYKKCIIAYKQYDFYTNFFCDFFFYIFSTSLF